MLIDHPKDEVVGQVDVALRAEQRDPDPGDDEADRIRQPHGMRQKRDNDRRDQQPNDVG
jgi:hypothetical protein